MHLMMLFSLNDGQIDQEQAYCMAINIYHEARSESIAGQIEVAHATMERVRDKRFPSTICGVVLQTNRDSLGRPKLYRCSFSWFCDGKPDDIEFVKKGKFMIIDYRNFMTASMVALRVINGDYKSECEGANFYYNPTLASPRWAKHYTLKCRIGNHAFHRREKGSLL